MKDLLQLFTWKDIRTRGLIYVIFALITAPIQTSLIYIIEIDEYSPDLLLLLVVWIVLKEGRFRGIVFAFSAGLLLDFISSGNLGVNALAKTVSAFGVGFFFKAEKKEANTHTFRFVWFVMLGSIINFAIYYFLNMDYLEFSWDSYFFLNIPASSVYTSVLASIIVLLFPKDKGRF